MDVYSFIIGIIICIGINIVLLFLNYIQLRKLRQFRKDILKIPISCLLFMILYGMLYIVFLDGLIFIILSIFFVLEAELPYFITLTWQHRLNKILRLLVNRDGKI